MSKRHRKQLASAASIRARAPQISSGLGMAIIEGSIGGLLGLMTGSIWKKIDEQAAEGSWSEQKEARGDGYRIGFTVASTVAGILDGWRRGSRYH